MYSFDMDSDDNMSDLSDDNVSVYSNASNISLSNHLAVPHKILTIDDVFCQMNEQIKNISDIMHIPPTAARTILDHYNWQSDRLSEKFIAADSELDREAFYRDAKILNPKYNLRNGLETAAGLCLICYDTGETTGLQCGHKFCRDCWTQYLSTKIVEYCEQRIPCPDSKCIIVVDDEIVRSIISDPDVLQKYNRSICNNYVKFKKNLSWCTSPGCNYVIDQIDSTAMFATCKCGNQFCLECHEQTHSPITCSLLKRWKNDDSATQSYLSVNTKPCPKCFVSIEKNGGCPHMTCGSCRYEFCWKCLKQWSNHVVTYQCNFPDDDIQIRKSRTQLQRLTYCWDRYAYNRQAWKEEGENFNIPWEQFEHRASLKASLSYIFECRRFLMYSYAFVYYLKENNTVHILETNLDIIEGRLDEVTVTLENYIRLKESGEDFESKEAPIRFDIVDKAAHCNFLRQTWLDNIEEGQIHDTWEYSE